MDFGQGNAELRQQWVVIFQENFVGSFHGDKDDNDGGSLPMLFPWTKSRRRGSVFVWPTDGQAVKARVPSNVRKKLGGRTGSWKFRKRREPQRHRKSCCYFRRRPLRLGIDRTLETKVL
ncbi:unnamed protein product [Linum trigynum]|uniref:Uncharacterized protein n=1 Tax=Linum trigynum TaxID=586398 RepID=A0AAV2CS95_9ROSI